LLGFQSYLRQPLAALPYQVLKVSADSHAFYTWNIAKEASLLLQGNGHSINEVDAYEDLGLSSVLACEERHYRWIINRDGSTTSIALTNGAQKILATSVSQWATALPTNEL